jgi:hypothetical protein
LCAPFSWAGFLDRVTYGPTGTEFTPMAFTALNHTHIRVVVGPGIGQGLVFSVRVAGQTSPLPDGRSGGSGCSPTSVGAPAPCVSYALPTILGLTPGSGPTNPLPTAVGTLTGTNFGLLDRMVDVVIVFGGCLASFAMA